MRGLLLRAAAGAALDRIFWRFSVACLRRLMSCTTSSSACFKRSSSVVIGWLGPLMRESQANLGDCGTVSTGFTGVCCSVVAGAFLLEAPEGCCLELRGVCLGVPENDVSQLAAPSRTLAREDARTDVDRLGLLGTVSRRGVLERLGSLFSWAASARAKRVGVADAEREGAAVDDMVAANMDMPMRRAARLAVQNLGVVGSVRVSLTGAAAALAVGGGR